MLCNRQGVEGHFLKPCGRPLPQLSMCIIHDPEIFLEQRLTQDDIIMRKWSRQKILSDHPTIQPQVKLTHVVQGLIVTVGLSGSAC